MECIVELTNMKIGKNMKTVLVLCFLVLFVVSMSSAELLTTANSIKGKFVGLGTWIQDSNVSNNKDYKGTCFGGYVGYGLIDQLDILFGVGSVTLSGLPSGFESSIIGYGPMLKYTLITEGENFPISVAVGGGYKLLSKKVKIAGLGEITTDGSQRLLGVGVSKLVIPFVPYTGVLYRNISGTIGDSYQIDITLGTAIAWSMQGAVLVEYTHQLITPSVRAQLF